ncbi:pilus assembly protein [Moritella marina ATCC 15381]|uniref:Pilus assembly protein n=1 Tax=Moritella marina ATCC 15381 TaxID=1202962 RepID=A0A5J6WLU8_MORMI|nr:TadE family protein [Moritella marina]QFI38020.1 pilus assembly protein [Moritella marina ATCC 15381]
MILSNRINRQQGGVSIEFAVTILPFFVLLLGLIEISRFMMVSSMVDVALSSAARGLVVDNSREDLTAKLQLTLSEQELPLLNGSDITVQGHYFTSLDALKNDDFVASFDGQDFAEFTLFYPYKSLFVAGFSDSFARLSNFKRTTLVTVERSANYAN